MRELREGNAGAASKREGVVGRWQHVRALGLGIFGVRSKNPSGVVLSLLFLLPRSHLARATECVPMPKTFKHEATELINWHRVVAVHEVELKIRHHLK